MTRNGDTLIPALEAALQKGPSHDSITWLLLERGASSSQGALIAALKRKSEELLDVILEGHWRAEIYLSYTLEKLWNAVVEWLSPPIIRKLASLH
jgi:hypothetical protein